MFQPFLTSPSTLWAPAPGNAFGPLVPDTQDRHLPSNTLSDTATHGHANTLRYPHSDSYIYIYTYPDSHRHTSYSSFHSHMHTYHSAPGMGSQHSLKATPHRGLCPLFQGPLSMADIPPFVTVTGPEVARDKGEQGSQAQGYRETDMQRT